MKGTFSPNERIGSYELLLSLGSGGMAAVILARRRGAADFERLAVVKRVHRRHLGDKAFIDMFRDEARLASSIRHPNVASVVDVVETGGELCLVMDYFESISLSALLDGGRAANEPLAPPLASRVVCDALAGLHAAHEAADLRGTRLGIVHRDLSPHNLIVDVEGITRVIDFGIARAESRLTKTKSGFVKGKIGYMSPEQIEAAPVDRRSDLFAVGIVLFEALAGRRLFSSDDEFETIRRVLRGDVPDISSAVPGMPRGIDAVLRTALARRPDDRYSTALSFQQALAAIAPPAPAIEVAAVVAKIGGPSLRRVRQELDGLLGLARAKEADRAVVASSSPPTAGARGTRGKTLPMVGAPRPRAPPAESSPRSGASQPAEAVSAPARLEVDDESDVGPVAGVPSRGATTWLLAAVLAGLVVALGSVAYLAFSMPYLRR